MNVIALPSAAVLLSEITWVFNIFLFFSFAQADRLMWISYWPWVLGGIFLLIWNRWFLRQQRTLVFLIIINALWLSGGIVLGKMFFFHTEGI